VIVLLDNCEHLLDAAASVVTAVLTRCPRVRIVATSREPLSVSGEALLPVPPLAADAAVRLFAERAGAVRPDFTLDDPTTVQVDDVCDRLDRLPLAIELAAARVRALPVVQIAARLQDRFSLLTTGPRDADERHRTLRAAVKWSYDLLFEHEKAAFQRFAIFPATFDLPAAEALCATADIAAGDAADVVEHLVDKSLLVERDGRYRMLATLREFAFELLEQSQGAERAAAAHAAYFLARVRDQAHLLYTREELPWLDSLEQNIDNIRAALAWATEHDPAAGLATIGVLAPSAWMRGYRQEARHIIDTLLALDPGCSPIDRCRALRWGAGLADAAGWTGHRTELARELALGESRSAEAVDLAEQAGDEIELAYSLRHHAVSLIRQGTYTGDTSPLNTAGGLLDRAELLFAKHEDDWGTAITLVTRMFNAIGAGQLDETEALCQRAWPTAEAIGERLILERILYVQALLAEAAGDLAQALAIHERALALSRELKFVEAINLHGSQLRLLGASVTAADRPSPFDLSAAAAARTAGAKAAARRGDRELAEALEERATTTYESIEVGITSR
jgi:predicted ATPase